MPRLSGMRRREAADAEQRLRHRDIGLLGERPHDVHRARQHDAVPGENQRPLGGVDELERALELFGPRAPVGTELRLLRHRGVPVELARRLLCVLGDVDVHRARPSRRGDLEGLAEGRRDLVGARHQIVVLGNRQRDARDVGFLERIRADQLAAHLTGDADDGRAVHHRRRDARHHVRRAGAGRRDGDADLAAGTRVAVGHVRRALLVAHEDVADWIVQHRVVRRAESRRRDSRRRRSLPGGRDIPKRSVHLCVSSHVLLRFSPRGAVHRPRVCRRLHSGS